MGDELTADLPVLKAGPPLQARAEVVPVPELGGSVVVRGLLASEVFALLVLRGQALKSQREAARQYRDMVAELPAGAERPAFVPPDLTLDELRLYGRYSCNLLAASVFASTGMALYSAEQWELVPQHHPAVLERLTAVAERLSGLNEEDVRKN